MVLRKISLWILITLAGLGVYAQNPQEGWNFAPAEDEFKEDAWLDLSYLNEAEAGQSGFIGLSADGNSFIDGNGDPIRFWATGGAGLSSSLNDAELEYFAKFLAKRGVNIIRFHAEISPNETLESDINNPNMEEVDHIWRAVAAFKKEGIYTVISPHWPNNIVNAPQGWGLGEYSNHNGGVWAVMQFDDVLRNAYKNWVSILYGEENPYTGIPLKDDPAVALIQIQNEDGLFFWTIQGVKPGLLNKMENAFYHFLIGKYGTIEEAYTAWDGDDHENDAPENEEMGIEIIYFATLPDDELAGISPQRITDQVQFMAEHQRSFYEDLYNHYRITIGCQQLINTTNWKTASALRLFDAERWTNEVADVIAVNRYVSPGHVNFNNPSYDGYRIDPGDYYEGESVLVNPSKLPTNSKQVDGHPFLITESGWNLPHKYQAEGPWLISAYSSLSGIDGYFWFSPSHQGYDDNPYRDFNREYENIDTYPMFRWTTSIPGMTAMYPANAYLFRKNLLQEGEVMLHEERPLESIWSREIPLIVEENGFDPNRDSYGDVQAPSETEVIPLAFLTGQVRAAYGTGGNTSINPQIDALIDVGNKTIGSSTGELNWDYGKGICTMSAPLAQGVVGFLSDGETNGTYELPDVTIRSKNEYAAITVVSMDDMPLSSSGEILIQIGTVYRPTNWIETPATFEPSEGNSVEGYRIDNTGKMPWKAVNTLVSMTINNTTIQSAHAVNVNGEKGSELVLFEAEDGVELYLPTNVMYVMLTTEPATVTGVGALNDNWNLYPNPTDGDFVVTLTPEIRNQVTRLELIDIMGRKLIESEFQGAEQMTINKAGLFPGIYVVVLKSGEKVIDRRKLIVK